MPAFSWPLYITPPALTVVDEPVSAIEQTRRDFLLPTSEGAALTVIGQNAGVPRPPLLTDDAIYRRCVQVLARQPKMILFTTEALLAAIFGPAASLVRPWRVYEVNANEIVIEIPQALIARSNDTASYFQSWDGYAYNDTGVDAAVFTTEGDVQSCTAENLGSGISLSMNVFQPSTGLWLNDLLINAISYDAATNLTTITLDDVYIPPGGTIFYIKVKGDGVDSYVGDYVAPSGHVATFSTPAGGGVTDQIAMPGDFATELENGMAVTLIYNGAQNDHTINSAPTFDPDTNLTTFVVASATVPEGLNNGVLVRAIEVAGDGTTVGVDNRVYFTGEGLYDIFTYYFDLLVRAAGITVRLERI